jgi:hypothetical protein
MIASLGRLSAARIVRSSRLWLSLGVWCSLDLAFAVVAREHGWAHGADRVLSTAFGALSLPFIACAIARAAFGGRSMLSSTAPLVAFGAAPWRAAFASTGVATLATALVGASLAALVALVAHGTADPPPVHDAIVSAYVGGLGGAAYATWFALGTTIGRRGGGRLLLLGLDWLLGGAGTPTALATPRGHLRNLLGGASPLNLSERWSAIMLLGMMVFCTMLACRGTKRR